jgi:hypothetical protein
MFNEMELSNSYAYKSIEAFEISPEVTSRHSRPSRSLSGLCLFHFYPFLFLFFFFFFFFFSVSSQSFQMIDKNFFKRMESLHTPLLLIESFVQLVQRNDAGTLGATPKKLLKVQKGIYKWTPASSSSKAFQKELLAQLDNRLADVLLPGPALQAAALHPRYGSMDYLNSTDIAEASRLFAVRNNVWKSLEELGCRLDPNTDPIEIKFALESIRRTFEAEGFSEEHKKKKTGCLSWWDSSKWKAHLLPLLKAVLAVPASSAEVERTFSTTGNLMDGRHDLSLDNLEQIAFITRV